MRSKSVETVPFSVYRTREGRIRSEDPKGFEAAIARFTIGEIFQIDVGPLVTTRSAKANRYLWGHVYKEMAKHTGHSAEDLHDAMCERFLPNEQKRVAFFNKMTGENLVVETDGRRSSKLNGTAFYDFVEEVRAFARDFLGVETQDPDPEWWRKRDRKAA